MAQPVSYVVGAGLSGLAAAVRLAQAGRRVRVYEASAHAGGRCRSFHDATLGRSIDNGNHLVLSGNKAVAAFLSAIGAADRLAGPARAEYPFLDLASGARWVVRPGSGPIPWWILSRKRRVPQSRPRDYLTALRLALAGPGATVSECLDGGNPLFARFWEPLSVAVLNAAPADGAAALLRPVVLTTFGRGEAACRPRLARDGLGPCFVSPAIEALTQVGGSVSFRRRVRHLDRVDDRITSLHFADGERVPVGEEEDVIVATPPAAAAELVPGLTVPIGSNAIVNGHFLLPAAVEHNAMIGLVGGFCQWVFTRDDVASVTISAADHVADHSNQLIAERMWPDVCRALELGARPLPPYRIVKEKRATFAQTPANASRRPSPRTPWRNLFLAGDWTATGLPATVEGSVLSGQRAARLALASAAIS